MNLRFFREPLFHFFVLGLAIFGWYFWLNPQEPASQAADQIVIDTQDLERLSAQFRSTWQRSPTEAELRGLVDSLVREEVLVREARVLGLDQGDGVVRNRLAQKMTFLTTSVAQSLEPEDAALIAFMEENVRRFVTPPRIAFEQILLPPNVEPTEALAALEAGASPTEIGKSTLLPNSASLSSVAAIDGSFGRGVFEQLAAAPVGAWSGPVVSGYGQHLVRVTEIEESGLPPFEEIREDVLLEWRREQTAKLTEAQMELLKAQYEIVTPDAAELTGQEAQ